MHMPTVGSYGGVCFKVPRLIVEVVTHVVIQLTVGGSVLLVGLSAHPRSAVLAMGERGRVAHAAQIKAIRPEDFVSESVDNLRFRRRL
jgi:hypothetical protein